MHADFQADHDDFGGLHRDLAATAMRVNRRHVVRALGIIGSAATLASCGDDASPTAPTSTTTTTTTTTTTDATLAGLTLANGTLSPAFGASTMAYSVSVDNGVANTTITAMAASSTATIKINPLSGRAVYLWHCDRAGGYSLYSSGVTNQNYLRGIQAADASGQVTFLSIYPGCYAGRWPHIHFEVFPSLAASSSAANKVATSQIALPRSTNDLVYATTGYEASVRNQAQVSLASDNVFSDGYQLELATVTGSVVGGFTATLTVAV